MTVVRLVAVEAFDPVDAEEVVVAAGLIASDDGEPTLFSSAASKIG